MQETRIRQVKIEYEFGLKEFLQLLGLPDDADYIHVYYSDLSKAVKITTVEEK